MKIIPRRTSEALKFFRQVRFLPDFDPNRADISSVRRKVTKNHRNFTIGKPLKIGDFKTIGSVVACVEGQKMARTTTTVRPPWDLISKAIEDAVAENKIPTQEYIIKALPVGEEASIMRGLTCYDTYEKREDGGFYIRQDGDLDDDDISHDPEIRAMWERGEHTCEMFDAHCAVCENEDEEDEEEDEDGEVMTYNL